ncbi:hypothetical protein K438DRAFT_1759888 [Mycena galopus ATCC 62051]|nr:hypothetical protein K438DRAFT_1759888 [Mycena galopus ATCC 62051]
MTTYLLPPGIAGPTLLAILFNWGFMGVLAAQLYFYHENFQHDGARVKLLVYGLFLLDVLQTVMVTADAFHWFVYGFGNLILADQTFLNSWDVPVLDSVISVIVQAFYCWRIHILRKGLSIPLVILLERNVQISLTQFGAGITTGIRENKLGQLSLLTQGNASPETVWLAGGAVADVAIAGVLSWTLLRERTYCLPPNQTIISRLIRHIVETNALTAIIQPSNLFNSSLFSAGVAVTAVILFWAAPTEAEASVATPIAILGKLYTNCLLALFNARVNNRMNHGMVSLHLSGNPDLGLDLGPRQSNSNPNPQHYSIPRSVKVHVEHQTDLGYDSVHSNSTIQKPSPIFIRPKSPETKSS